MKRKYLVAACVAAMILSGCYTVLISKKDAGEITGYGYEFSFHN